ncbi:MAG: hypothetical protein U5L06_02810 [Rhodovibrio sp.]|nr:hypothetical protein [Rhodovibrio sp.]
MILQVLANVGVVLHDLHPALTQERARPDAGELEDLRRPHRAGCQDHLAVGRDARVDAVVPQAHPGNPPALQLQPLRLRLRQHGQVGAVLGRTQESVDGVPAPAAALGHLEVAHPLVAAAVEIVRARDARLLGRVGEGVQDFPGDPHAFHAQFAARPVQVVRAPGVILVRLEMGQHVVPAPAGAAQLAPAVVIARLAAHVDHAVDRRAAAQHPPARIVERAAVQPVLRFGPEAPVRARIVDGVEVADRDPDPDVVVLPARLEQQDRNLRVRAQPVGEHAAGTARAHDDIVEPAQILGRLPSGHRLFASPCEIVLPAILAERGRQGETRAAVEEVSPLRAPGTSTLVTFVVFVVLTVRHQLQAPRRSPSITPIACDSEG